MMVNMALKEMDRNRKSIKEEFKTLRIDISESTGQRRLKNGGLKSMKLSSKPLLKG